MNMKLSLVIGLIGLACIRNTSRATNQALPGCRDRCGNVTVPYPFGNCNNCFSEEKFNVACHESTGTPIPYLGTENLPITDISLRHGELQVLQTLAADCYEQTGVRTNTSIAPRIQLRHSKFTVSATKNKFTAVGCDTHAVLIGYRSCGKRFQTGRVSRCDRAEDVDFGPSCSGAGCCQLAPIPSGIQNFTIEKKCYANHTNVWSFNPCSYAVPLAEETTRLNLTNKGLQHFGVKQDLPLVLDWGIGNLSCAEARTTTNFACKANSECASPDAGSVGYLCRCLPGFEGNPYHPEDCHGIATLIHLFDTLSQYSGIAYV
ncbi:Wall-associated receptor kinase, galacturonan-binding domain containing protein [Trema orientale]|uniref:Wall-associated receptor kinase, galacturonan-binding domain containing protein n=1 Tax=Trema orientale TaxID=63057 RepID=A0A2P5FTB2_TREOI|nr:Wall-associated receptor kinase, galacturonan-binding domain containing protein [Trema orientale]